MGRKKISTGKYARLTSRIFRVLLDLRKGRRSREVSRDCTAPFLSIVSRKTASLPSASPSVFCFGVKRAKRSAVCRRRLYERVPLARNGLMWCALRGFDLRVRRTAADAVSRPYKHNRRRVIRAILFTVRRLRGSQAAQPIPTMQKRHTVSVRRFCIVA